MRVYKPEIYLHHKKSAKSSVFKKVLNKLNNLTICSYESGDLLNKYPAKSAKPCCFK
jgi:hypothetical protein